MRSTPVKTDPAMLEVIEVLRSHPRFLVTSHARPDGDAVGSVLAMGELLGQMGVSSDLVLADAVPVIYQTLPGVERIRLATSVDPAGPDAAIPCILLECDSTSRTGISGLDGGRLLINIDHHTSGRNFGDINWIDPSACAVGAMVYRIARETDAEITASIATCLYTAIVSDTGAFTYDGTSSETFALAQELSSRGANPGQIARDVYFSNSESKTRLLGTALSRMQRDGRVAWSWVTLEDMQQTAADTEDCEGVVNHLIAISGVEAAVFLRELPETNRFRLSMRSKGTLDVARVAELFGGGGHRTASGCTLNGSIQEATGRIVTQLRSELC